MRTLRILRRPPYAVATVALAVLLGLLYVNLSLRSAGMETTIATTSRATPQFEIEEFGPAYYYTSVALDALSALLAAVLIVLTVAAYRARRGAAAGTAGAGASLAIAATTFG
ncbi:MAG: hypothetical protein M3Q29_07625 [Chloroflexota bacterium]|nr:hypothetical protein [Chloroflexota bacterium]